MELQFSVRNVGSFVGRLTVFGQNIGQGVCHFCVLCVYVCEKDGLEAFLIAHIRGYEMINVG